MSDGSPTNGRSILVRGRGSPSDAVVDAAAERDGVSVARVDATARGADGDDDPDVVFAVGESALLTLASTPTDRPVVPVEAGTGRYDVASEDVTAAVDAAATGRYETVAHPIVDAAVNGEPAGAALADVTLMTSAPARISEYGIESPDGWTERVRSDGVVVATPLGSAGYARAVGGPLLAPATGLVTVPVSPYAMHTDAWVVRPPVRLTVERDEAAVSLRLDDRVAVESVPPNTPVEVGVDRELSLVRPQSIGDF
ncbi:NAD(+)/NADH kinase [Halobellus limi]|uniref:NAD+ kinase n=1 Tax=Halobellus limi TaxID=699433 RepID=A0A1H5Z0E5_9EURY|nr:NAD(+)/NADH kinase [Halobellus limi]SEG30013.1 NAD+ kinase [Halobellus limi]